jgi:hypothetical protein
MTHCETTGRLVGVWIDHEKAIVVTLSRGITDVQTVLGDVEPKHRSTGGTRSGHPYSHRSVESTSAQSAWRLEQIRRLFDQVEALIDGADELVVLGPGEAKDEFATFLGDTHRQGTPSVKASATVPSHLTEPQIAAQVREMFGHPSPRKKVTIAGAR